jgi:hypothetical protein
MPPKRKDNAGSSAASGPKQKRSKTSFRTPTAGLEASAETEIGFTTNRVVTLRSSASGRRGYRTQDLSTTPSSSRDSLPAENLALPPDIPDTFNSIPSPTVDLESDTVDIQPGSSAKSRRKQKNTTTVR